MAFTIINTTDTLEQMRVKLNNLTTNDFGDPADLTAAGLSSTSVIGAVIELNQAVVNGTGFNLVDSTSTVQNLLPGQTFTILGTTNQINAVISNPDTLTISLPNDVTINGNFTASGSTHNLGTVQISGNTIRSTDSTRLYINDTLRADGLATGTGLGRLDETGGYPRFQSFEAGGFMVFDAIPVFNSSIVFEGSVADAFETTLTVTNPTADRTITIPNISGTLITTGDTGTVTNTMLAGSITTSKISDAQITEAKIASGAVGSTQLKNVVSISILNSSGGVLKTLYGAGA